MMECPKCGGLMNPEEFMNLSTEGPSWGYEGWRCLYCGEIIDPLILENRIREKGKFKKGSLAGSGRGRKTALCHS